VDVVDVVDVVEVVEVVEVVVSLLGVGALEKNWACTMVERRLNVLGDVYLVDVCR